VHVSLIFVPIILINFISVSKNISSLTIVVITIRYYDERWTSNSLLYATVMLKEVKKKMNKKKWDSMDKTYLNNSLSKTFMVRLGIEYFEYK